MQTRRKFLLTTGALTTASTVGSVTASSQTNELTTEVVNEALLSGVAETGSEGAEQALEELGLDPTVKETRDFDLTGRGTVQNGQSVSTDDQQISPDNAYEDPDGSDSALVVSASPAMGSEPEVYVSVSMILSGRNKTVRNSWWAPDAIGIGFLEDDWAPVENPTVSATHDHTGGFTASDVDDDALAGTIIIENHDDNGAASSDSLPEASASLTGKFRLRDDGEPSNFWGTYIHTFASTPVGSIDSITGGYGGLSAELSWGSIAWSIADSTDPQPHL